MASPQESQQSREKPFERSERSRFALSLIEISEALFPEHQNRTGDPFLHMGISYRLIDNSNVSTYDLVGQRVFTGEEDKREEIITVRTSRNPGSNRRSYFSYCQRRWGRILEFHVNSPIAAQRIRDFFGLESE